MRPSLLAVAALTGFLTMPVAQAEVPDFDSCVEYVEFECSTWAEEGTSQYAKCVQDLTWFLCFQRPQPVN